MFVCRPGRDDQSKNERSTRQRSEVAGGQALLQSEFQGLVNRIFLAVRSCPALPAIADKSENAVQ